MSIPNYTNRSADDIISQMISFDSVGYTFRALSWLDIAKKRNNVCALQYSAYDTRQAIETWFFEAIVVSVGTNQDQDMYEKCKGNGAKLHKILNKLSPSYEKLVEFTQALCSVEPIAPNIVDFDRKLLMKHWGKVSNYMHWSGSTTDTVESSNWLEKGIETVETATNYIWSKKTAGYTGILNIERMIPETKEIWDKYQDGKIDIATVKRTLELARPILKKRVR